MILNFEEYINSQKIIKESFQSGKLRNIIKQHGKPKHTWDYKILYDLKDNEVIDILPSSSDFYHKYNRYDDNDKDIKFYIELEDGYCLVIGNIGVLKHFFKDEFTQMRDVFVKRHKERHKGNLGKYGGDDIHKKHMDRVNAIEHRRNVEKIQNMLTDDDRNKILDAIETNLENSSDFPEKSGEYDDEIEVELFGETATLYVTYEFWMGDEYTRYGAILVDIENDVNTFVLYVDTEDMSDEFTPDELQIDLRNIKSYKERGFEIGIDDPYDYYGVSRADFL